MALRVCSRKGLSVCVCVCLCVCVRERERERKGFQSVWERFDV